MIVERGDGRRVAGPLEGVGLQDLQADGVDQLRLQVCRGRDEVGAIRGQLHVRDDVVVQLPALHVLAGLRKQCSRFTRGLKDCAMALQLVMIAFNPKT